MSINLKTVVGCIGVAAAASYIVNFSPIISKISSGILIFYGITISLTLVWSGVR